MGEGEAHGVDHRERRFEVVATVVLALAGLGAAFAGYQASLWDGNQSERYGEAANLRLQANESRTDADEDRLADLTAFENYVDATIDGDQEQAAFYRDRFRDELVPAYQEWIALDPFNDRDTPPNPMALDSYHIAAADEADRLNTAAHASVATGDHANDVSDNFTLATLVFAAVLFFSAISERFEVVPARLTLLGLAMVGLVGGFLLTFSQPLTWT